MATIQVDPNTRERFNALKADFDFDNADDFMTAALDFIEENADAFEEGIEDEDEEK